MNKIVTLGGGGGQSRVLEAIKSLPNIDITAICPNTDSGGSTGILRRQYGGGGYVGDLTKCITALCNDQRLSSALSFRYQNGALNGHSAKNLLFHALEKTNGAVSAIESMSDICGLDRHRVIPISLEKTELCASLKTGLTVTSETNINELARNPLWTPGHHAIEEIYLQPKVKIWDVTARAIKDADHIIICPGDLYSSILPIFLPTGTREAIKKSRAEISIIVNIVNKRGETDGYKTEDFVSKIEKSLGRKANRIVCNDALVPLRVLAQQSLEKKDVLLTPNIRDKRFTSAPLARTDREGRIWSDPREIREVLKFITHKQ